MTNDLGVLVRSANPVPTIDHLSADEFDAALVAIETSLTEHTKQRRFMPFFQRIRTRPSVVFVTAVAVVVLAIAVPLFLFATSEGDVVEPVTTTVAPVTTTAAPTTTTTAVTTTEAVTTTTVAVVPLAVAPEIAWTRVPHQPAFDSAEIGQYRTALVPGGPGLVGVGHVVGEAENLHAAVFVSADGETWERIDDPFRNIEDAKWMALSDVAVDAVGRLVIGGGDRSDAAVWISSDAYSWDRVSSEVFGGSDLQNILGVVAGGPGFVAVGDDGSNAGVWVSRDGFEWSKVEDEDLLAGDDLSVTMYDVAVGGPGLVAAGSAGLYDGDGVTGAIWVSRDGYQWERLARETFAEESGDWGFQSMTRDPSTERLVVFGSELWISDRGYEWQVTELDPLDSSIGAPPPGAEVAWNGDTAVAAGMDMAFSLWVSGDAGSNWTRIEPVEPAFDDFYDQTRAVAWFNGRWVVAGQGSEGGAVWIGTPEE